MRQNAFHHLTVGGTDRNDRSFSGFATANRIVAKVEPKISLPPWFIRAVTAPAVIRQDRTNVASKLNLTALVTRRNPAASSEHTNR